MADQETATLRLPYIMPAQAQKHVTHNEAIQTLDALVQTAVEGVATVEPASTADGRVLIVGEGAEGLFAEHALSLAVFQGGAWRFHAPQVGWRVYDRASAELRVFTGEAWEPLPVARNIRVDSVGVRAAADGVSRLAVAAPASLLTHDGEGHQLKINKKRPAATASLLYQSDYAGRAEMGLAGTDDFSVKVSPDGESWHEAIRVERSTGRVRFPSGGARLVLDRPRRFHVAPGGDDGASGLTPGEPFGTLQQAVDAALALDANGHAVTIHLAPGHFAGADMSRPMFDGGTLALEGPGAGPGEAVIDGGQGGPALRVDCAGAKLRARNVKIAGQVGVWARYGAVVYLRGAIVFGPVATRHVGADNGGYVEIIASVRIEGGAQQHLFGNTNGHVLMTASSVTLVDQPHFATAFADARNTGVVSIYGNDYTGDATGLRYRASGNGVINVNKASESALPGSAAGTRTTGGVYG